MDKLESSIQKELDFSSSIFKKYVKENRKSPYSCSICRDSTSIKPTFIAKDYEKHKSGQSMLKKRPVSYSSDLSSERKAENTLKPAELVNNHQPTFLNNKQNFVLKSYLKPSENHTKYGPTAIGNDSQGFQSFRPLSGYKKNQPNQNWKNCQSQRWKY